MLNCCNNRVNPSCNSTEVVMDIVYENFLNSFHREKQGVDNEIVKFSDFFKIEGEFFSEINKKDISITKLNDGKFFVSNCKDKGFFVEKNSNIDKVIDVSIDYKKLQKNIGKITDIYGFTNRYFENIFELFSNDSDSKGLGEFTSEFLARSHNKPIIGKIDIENFYTIGYEGNGNRILLDKDNQIYIYAHDLATRYYQKIDNIPQNTILIIPNLLTLNDFVSSFFTEFLN